MLRRRLKKSKTLQLVNLLGLTVIFCCLILSLGYIKKELSYDRFHEHADRICRLSRQKNDEPVDGRFYAFNRNSPVIADVPGVEDAVLMQHNLMGVLEKEGKPEIVSNFYAVSPNFFEVFSYPLLEGDRTRVLDAPGKVLLSRSYARQLFGEEPAVGKEIRLSGRQLSPATDVFFVTGIFEDFPENTHFHTDLLVHLPNEPSGWTYVYLLLYPGADRELLSATIAENMQALSQDPDARFSPYIMPLTDIHLHSRVLRELESNGNIYYVYLIAGANLLLLLVVMFNLWLNAGLVFSMNRKYYRLLLLNGAPSSVVFRSEAMLGFSLGIVSLLLGGLVASVLFPQVSVFADLTVRELVFTGAAFVLLVAGVYLLPLATRMAEVKISGFREASTRGGFSLTRVKYLLIAQYAIVIFIVIVSFGISRQIGHIRTSQVGGHQDSILVMKEQPEMVLRRYDQLKSELLKITDIKTVTSAMQLPGSAIRDGISVRLEGEAENARHDLQLLVAGEDFLPFFDLEPVAGSGFSELRHSYEDEMDLFMTAMNGMPVPFRTEEYMINRKAAQTLGFGSPEEAVGKHLYLDHPSLNYIPQGVIVGVTNDYNYATTYEETAPQILIQRKMFQHCILVHLSSERKAEALRAFNEVWGRINPDYPADYLFLHDLYGQIYYNEMNAETLTRLFSMLCLIIANLGLVIIMAFVIRRKTKEIGIRKVNGASRSQIVGMLNSRFVVWIGAAFVLAVPGSYYVMNRWLQNFAIRTSLEWWVFVLAGVGVLLLSGICVSGQSWRAATMNPVKSLKSE